MKIPTTLRKMLWFWVFCISILFATSQNSTAQQTEAGLTVGVKTGFVSGTFTTMNLMEVSSTKNGYLLGVSANYQVMDMLAISGELLFNRTGAADLDPLFLYSDENAIFQNKIVFTSVSNSMISVPIYASFTLPGVAGSVFPKIFLGGDFSYYLSSKALNNYNITSGSTTYFSSSYESLGSRLKKIDYGVFLGTGFSIPGESLIYTFDIRYRFGINNINNTSSDFINNSLHQNSLMIAFGIGFSL